MGMGCVLGMQGLHVHESSSGTGMDWNALEGLEQDWHVHESSSGIPHFENRNNVNDSPLQEMRNHQGS
jgi:hypothetical protein